MAKKKSNKLWYILGGIMVLLVIGAVFAKKAGWNEDEGEDVTTSKVKKRTIVQKVNATGKIYPEIEVKLSPDVSGEIINLYVDEGDSIVEGQLLVKIKPDIYASVVERSSAAVSQAQASLANARARLTQVEAQLASNGLSFERSQQLYNEGVISKADYEQAEVSFKNATAELEATTQNVNGAEFSVESARASLKESKDNLNKTTIYAPMSGIISALNVEKGERVVGTTQMAGTEMLRIADLSNMEARVEVSENDIIRIAIGDTCEIEADAYLDRTFYGVVSKIANSANMNLGGSDQVTNFEVKVRLLPSSYKDLIEEQSGQYPFRPGMSATVEIITETKDGVLTVPIQSVTSRDLEKLKKDEEQSSKGKDKDEEEVDEEVEEIDEDEDEDEDIVQADEELKEVVFLYNDLGEVNVAVVTTGIQDENYIEILEGLEEKSQVIDGPYTTISRKLKEGTKVNKVSKKELYSKNEKKK